MTLRSTFSLTLVLLTLSMVTSAAFAAGAPDADAAPKSLIEDRHQKIRHYLSESPELTADQVREEVRTCIDVLAGDGVGYILAPCHNIQSITPVENVLAMYDEAWNYGRF